MSPRKHDATTVANDGPGNVVVVIVVVYDLEHCIT